MNILNFKRLSTSTQVVARTLSNIKKEKTNLSNGIKSDSNAFTVLENYIMLFYTWPQSFVLNIIRILFPVL